MLEIKSKYDQFHALEVFKGATVLLVSGESSDSGTLEGATRNTTIRCN